jgi:uncharacterized membrane protein
MSRLVPVLGTALLFILVLSPAEASLRLCNRTSYVIYTATAATTVSGTDVKGWTRVTPGACEVEIQGDLIAQAYYLYARSARAHSGAPRAWSGQTNLCVKDRDFSLRLPLGVPRCTAPDTYELPFAAIQTHHMRSWTMTLRETPDLASMPAAERAGLKRLLGDVGVRNLSDDKAMDLAVTQFRKRTRLQDKSGPTALFNALETEAMKTAVPVGYTICNDTDKPVFAALGQKKAKAFFSSGWWTVAGGTCSQVMTESLSGAPVYLRVERRGGVPLVAGSMTFCVTNIEFEIQGRERCVKRGLAEAGFVETNVSGQPGYTAHITGSGLAAN